MRAGSPLSTLRCSSLTISALGFARFFAPQAMEHYEAYGLAIGITVMSLTFAAGLLPRIAARMRA